MRKIVSWILLGLGAFLLVTAVVAKVWAPDEVKLAPIDTNSTTRLAGTAQKLNTGTGEIEDLDVRAVSITKSDSEKSDDDVAVYINRSCLVIDVPNTPDCGVEGTGEDADPNVISISDDIFATDRRTGEAVNDDKYIPDGTPDHEGLINKWPFDAEKTDYDYWDGVLDSAVTATYAGTEDLNGLETYKYTVSIVEEPAKVIGDVDGLYSLDKTIWIEPDTGKIVNQEQHDVRTLPNGDPLLDLRLAFTEEQQKADVDDGRDSADSLKLLTSTVPLIGFIVGPILLIAGVIGLALGRRSEQTGATPRPKRAKTTA